MNERGILFSGMMVNAILDGHKTKTRRVVKPQPDWVPEVHSTRRTESFIWPVGSLGQQCGAPLTKLPYGVPGDMLWVRERLARASHLWTYVADGTEVGWPARRDLASKRLDYAPSIHMPRVASRLTLELISVAVERAHDITEADAQAEGIFRQNVIVNAHCAGGRHTEETEDRFFYPGCPEDGFGSAVEAFEHLWIKINGKKSWDANPWLWVLEFKVHRMNIDAFKESRS